ncbi:long-chain fatty acid--CoA ligase [soil metagenome]
MLLHDRVMRAAEAFPDRPALIVDDEITTFAQLDQRVSALAGAVRRRSRPGDRVAFIGDNGPEWIDAYYGVPRAGRVLGFVNHRLGPEPLRAAVERLRPAILVAGRDQLDVLATLGPVAELAPVVVAIDRPGPGEQPYADLLAEAADARIEATGEDAAEAGPHADDTAWLIATSGTSGTPKVVELTHRNLIAAARGTIAVRGMPADDVYLFPFPLCHVAGYNVLIYHREARPVVVARRFTPASIIEQVATHRVTTMSLAPTMIHGLVDHLDEHGGGIDPLRLVTYGSSPIAPDLLARAIDAFDVDFSQGYGMTEMAGNGVFLSPEDHRRGLTTTPELLTAAGQVGPGVAVRLLDDAGDDVASGAAGEIAVKGEQVMKGYWEAPAVNAVAFHDGWFRTGDVGRFGPEGHLSVVDRKKDIIVSGGENVSSREVEDRLAAHPDVAEVAVVGAPDERWGEVVCAYVVARPGTDLDAPAVLAFGRTAIGGFQQPRRVELVDQLPRNGSGKVLKHQLRALAAEPL